MHLLIYLLSFINILLIFTVNQNVLLVVFVEKRSSKCLKKISININILQALKKFLLRICKKIDDYEKSKSKRNINDDLLFVSLQDDGFFVNHINKHKIYVLFDHKI